MICILCGQTGHDSKDCPIGPGIAYAPHVDLIVCDICGTTHDSVLCPQTTNQMPVLEPFKLKGSNRRVHSTEERYVPSPLPSDHERELLQITLEEAFEVAEVCGRLVYLCSKALRFGLDNVKPGEIETNRKKLAHEMGQVHCMTMMLEQEGIIEPDDVLDGMAEKMKKLAKFMLTKPERP